MIELSVFRDRISKSFKHQVLATWVHESTAKNCDLHWPVLTMLMLSLFSLSFMIREHSVNPRPLAVKTYEVQVITTRQALKRPA